MTTAEDEAKKIADEKLKAEAAKKASKDKADAQNASIETKAGGLPDSAGKDPNNYIESDDHFLVDLNYTLTELLRKDPVLCEANVDIWYDLPETEERTPDGPTICIYLYDVKENSSLRHGGSGSRGYSPADKGIMKQLGGYFNVQCSYLIIFWDKTSQHMIANNQNAIIASRIVTALLNTYYIDKIPEYGKFIDYDARFIQGSEQMNSISNFWQSLKQRPRLCLSYEVTVPIRIPIPDKDEVSAVIEETLNIYASQGEPVGKPLDSYILDPKNKDLSHPTYKDNPLATKWTESLTVIPKEEPKQK